MRTWIQLALVAVAILISAALYMESRSARLDSDRLKAQLAMAEQTLQQTTNNQHQREKQLAQTLAQLESLKATVKSQQQILEKLPDVLPLPRPLVVSGSTTATPQSLEISPNAKPDAPRPTALPAEDLKPLYDFAVDCKACQTKLTAIAAELADEKTKSQTLSRERDSALQAARAGSLTQRLKHAAKWFFIGAVAGAVAAKAH